LIGLNRGFQFKKKQEDQSKNISNPAKQTEKKRGGGDLPAQEAFHVEKLVRAWSLQGSLVSPLFETRTLWFAEADSLLESVNFPNQVSVDRVLVFEDR